MRKAFFVMLALMMPALAHAGLQIPCERVTSEESRVLAAAKSLANELPVAGCRIPRGNFPTPMFLTQFESDTTFLFIFSQEIDDTLTTDAIRGMVAHEYGHLLAKDHDEAFWRSLTESQRSDQEAAADRAATRLVVEESVVRALDEYAKLFKSMAKRSSELVSKECKRRRKILGKSDGH